MPGLVGIVSKLPEASCRAALGRMVASMKHEARYRTGTYACRDLFVHIGWICHDKEFADCMPIRNETKDVTLFLTGEIFDEPGCRDALRSRGHQFQDGDASYLAHLYEERGNQFFEELNGLYSGVLLDRRQKKAFLFNDRYGMKRLFVHEGKAGLYFASQAKALLAALPETRAFDPAGLAEYVTCGCTLGSASLYKDIGVLPSASIWRITDGSVEKKGVSFDRNDWERQERLDAKAFTDRVLETFPSVVRKYGNAAQPLGISLTGGLDSRMLVACLDMSPGEYPCYTFGSMYRETFDVKIARDVAKDCEQHHTVLVLGREFLRDFPRHMEEAISRSDGYLGLSGAAELYVNALARGIAPIRLTGNYGSELFRGVCAFKSAIPRGRFLAPDFQGHLDDARNAFQAFVHADPITFALYHQAPCQGYGRLSVEGSQVIMRTPFLDNDLVRLIYRRPEGYADGTRLSSDLITRCRPRLAEVATDRGDLGGEAPLSRLASRLYHEALFKAEYWGSHGMPQWVARLSGCAPWLAPEKIVLGLHKFQHFQQWLRRELSEYVRDVLLSGGQLPGCFERKPLERMVNSHLEGRGNFVDEIDKALTIVLSARFLLDPIHQEDPAGLRGTFETEAKGPVNGLGRVQARMP